MSLKNLAPIVLFCYKRLDTLMLTVEALKNNVLALDSDLIIYSDAAKNKEDEIKILNVRAFLKTISGFKTVSIFESPVNKGLANSIIDGVTKVFENHDSVIVLEDDLISSPNFLTYVNEALEFYKNEDKVFSICGYSLPIKKISECDTYFTHRSSSWGWATWRYQWSKIDWEVANYNEFIKKRKNKRNFNKMGSDMTRMLEKQMKGELNSWAIRWCFHQFQNNLFSVHPFVSKIENIGFSIEASNTLGNGQRFRTILDNGEKTNFNFSKHFILDKKYIRNYTKPFTIWTRVKYKIFSTIKKCTKQFN